MSCNPCSSTPPPAPDYAGAANAQGTANRETAYANAFGSNPNVYTPFGSQTVNWNLTPTLDYDAYDAALNSWREGGQQGAQPSSDDYLTSFNYQPSITQTLDPATQALWDQGMRIDSGLMGTAEQGISNIQDVFGSPFDASGLPDLQTGLHQWNLGRMRFGIDQEGLPPMPEASEAVRQQVIDAMYGQARSRLDPQWGQYEDTERTRLMNQGFATGSTGYERELDNLRRSRTDAYDTALNSAIVGGGAEQQRLFNMGLAARAQGFGERISDAQLNNAAVGQDVSSRLGLWQQKNASAKDALARALALRQLPLNELNALRTGTQLQLPQFPGFQGSSAAPGDIAGATNALGQWNTGLYNADAAQQGALMGTAGQLGAAGMLASGSW